MKYTINQMAKLLGTTSHKLRYYQKMGIITPIIEANSGYRYYSVLDTRRFNLACTYCNMGFSIQETLELLSDVKEDVLIDKLKDKKRLIEKEVALKSETLKRIDDINFYLDKVDESLNKVIIIERPNMIRVEFSNEETINTNKEIIKLRDDLIDLSPLIEWTSRISSTSMRNSNEPLEYFYGINIRVDYALNMGIDISKYDYIPGGKYLYTTFIKKNRTPFDYKSLKVIHKYINDNKITIESSGYSSCFYSTIENQDYKNYHFIMTKID